MLGFIALFTWLSYQAGLEAAAQKILISAVEDWLEDPDAPLPTGKLLQGVAGKEGLPERIRGNLERFEAEDYAIPLWEWEEIQLWKGTHPHTGKEVYIFLELGETADGAVFSPNLERGILLGGSVVLAGAVCLGYLISRRLSRPLRQLSREIAASGPETDYSPLAAAYPDGETGEVARAFDDLQARIRRFVERERRFTGDASHELRTPLTLMRTATTVLRNSLPDPRPKQKRALDHLDQGVEEMTRSVESFLLLARERELHAGERDQGPGDVLTRVISRQQEQFGRSADSVQLEISGEPDLPVPVELFRIVAGNLIRNALQYGEGKQVQVMLTERSLVVEDQGPGLPESVRNSIGNPFPPGSRPEGVGLGLSITTEIAARAGWTIEWQNRREGGARAVVGFLT